jgi:hypothetical protein
MSSQRPAPIRSAPPAAITGIVICPLDFDRAGAGSPSRVRSQREPPHKAEVLPDWRPSRIGNGECTGRFASSPQREKQGRITRACRGDRGFMDDTDTRRDSPRDKRAGSPRAVRSSPTDSGTPQAPANPPARGAAPAGVIDDPFAHLTPAERFARALERRDAFILKLSQGGDSRPRAAKGSRVVRDNE